MNLLMYVTEYVNIFADVCVVRLFFVNLYSLQDLLMQWDSELHFQQSHRHTIF